MKLSPIMDWHIACAAVELATIVTPGICVGRQLPLTGGSAEQLTARNSHSALAHEMHCER